jgi:hypothetical protein
MPSVGADIRAAKAVESRHTDEETLEEVVLRMMEGRISIDKKEEP